MEQVLQRYSRDVSTFQESSGSIDLCSKQLFLSSSLITFNPGSVHWSGHCIFPFLRSEMKGKPVQSGLLFATGTWIFTIDQEDRLSRDQDDTMPTVETLTTYLEMFAPPSVVLNPPIAGVSITPLSRPDLQTYRSLYRGVGGNYHWVDRLVMADQQLEAILSDPGNQIFILQVSGKTGGYCELDLRNPLDIELVYFGLFSGMIGLGLGRYFLNWTLHKAWSYKPRRVWVHTCDLDHPAALPNYIRAGMIVYDSRPVLQTIPENWSAIVSSGSERIQP